ncbi:RING/FYVE/PHD zinc finger superfamily protein [Trifolium repens]|jgi:hypothetical protein|nr:RING/FYVE/PHD zinc finger superfamily protein [Trifolium repens]
MQLVYLNIPKDSNLRITGPKLVACLLMFSILVINFTNYSTCLINRTCEICGSIAHNVAGAIEVQMTEQYNESSDPSMVPPTGPSPPSETRNFWQGHRFLNFLLACMVFAFVISWLFHFNVPS